MSLPTKCVLCNSTTRGKDLDPAKPPLDRGHMLLWDEPKGFVLFCKICWRKLERITKRRTP